MKYTALLFSSIVATFSLAGPAFAHHSGAMFDRSKTMTLKGTIKAFQWTNPHTWTHIDVPNAAGGVDEWRLEGGSPNILARTDKRWSKSALKPGDQVSIRLSPTKDGRKIGVLEQVTYANGEVLKGAGL